MRKAKNCLGCGQLITKENAYSRKNGNLHARCKSCTKEANRKDYIKNRDAILEKNKIKYRELKASKETQEQRARREEIEFLKEWNRLEEERIKRKKVIEQLKIKHKCYECKWGNWIELETKFICSLPQCWEVIK